MTRHFMDQLGAGPRRKFPDFEVYFQRAGEGGGWFVGWRAEHKKKKVGNVIFVDEIRLSPTMRRNLREIMCAHACQFKPEN